MNEFLFNFKRRLLSAQLSVCTRSLNGRFDFDNNNEKSEQKNAFHVFPSEAQRGVIVLLSDSGAGFMTLRLLVQLNDSWLTAIS